jgi:hypothetical protein
MKYSIRGNLSINDGSAVVAVINKYSLWRFVTEQIKDRNGIDVFVFEAWVNSIDEKTNLFNELKTFVDENGEQIDWHECTHDEPSPQPCIIAETYIKSG